MGVTYYHALIELLGRTTDLRQGGDIFLRLRADRRHGLGGLTRATDGGKSELLVAEFYLHLLHSMAGNPFHEELDDTFRETRVRAHTAEHTYEGWARLWHYNQPAVVLYDAVRDDGEHRGAVTIDAPRSSSASVHRARSKRCPSPQSLDSPYSVREPDDADHKRFVKLTRERGHLLTFPTVRPIDRDGGASENTVDAYEVVIGHRRVDTARKAGIETIAVRLRALDDWETVEHFVDDHIPIPGANESGLYSQQEIERAITRLRADWPDERLLELGPLAPYLREHLASTRQGALRQRDGDGRS